MAKVEGRYDLTLSMFQNKTQLADVDSTKPPTDWKSKHSLIFSNAAPSAQSVMPEQEHKAFTAKAKSQASPEERTYLLMDKYHQEIRKAQMRGYFLDETLPSVSFSWRADTGASCTLTIEPAVATHTARQKFLKGHQKIMERFWVQCSNHFKTDMATMNGQRACGLNKPQSLSICFLS